MFKSNNFHNHLQKNQVGGFYNIDKKTNLYGGHDSLL